MKTKTLLAILFTSTLLAGCSQPPVKLSGSGVDLAERSATATPKDVVVYPDDRPSIPDGKVVWEKQNCASCHGADGSGGSAGVKLNDYLFMSQQKPVDVYRTIFAGGDKNHPTYADKLSNREIWSVAVYARSLGCPPLVQAELEQIDPVFGSNCAVCHGTKGDGDGPLARNLEPWPANFQKFPRFYDRTDAVLFDHIANGIKWEGMPNFLGKKDSKKTFNGKPVEFDEPFIRKLVAYVRKFHISNEPTIRTASAEAVPAAPAASPEKTGVDDKGADKAEDAKH